MTDKFQLKALITAKDMLSPALRSIANNATDTRKHLLSVAKSAARIGAAGFIGASAGILGIRRIARSFADFSDEVMDTSQRLGMSTDEFQRLSYIARQSGSDIKEYGSAINILNRRLAEVAGGKNQRLTDLFRQAGISARDSQGQIKSAAEMLPEITALFERNQNAAVRARMGYVLFGGSWKSLAPLLDGGVEGLQELNRRFDELGITVDQDAIRAGKAFGDQMTELNAVARSYGTTIGAKLVPALTPMIRAMTDWLILNRELIANEITGYLKEFAAYLHAIDWKSVGSGIKGFIETTRSLINWLGGARNALIALFVVMNASAIIGLIISLGKLGVGLTAVSIKAVKAAGSMGAFNLSTASMAGGLKGIGGAARFAIGGIAGLIAAWQAGRMAGTALNNHVLNPMVKKLSGGQHDSLGSFVHDRAHSGQMSKLNSGVTLEEVNAMRLRSGKAPLNALPGRRSDSGSQPLSMAQEVKASGRIEVDFLNVPPGARVREVSKGGDIPVDLGVGYRGAALGLPS